jgi:hypothetical protein
VSQTVRARSSYQICQSNRQIPVEVLAARGRAASIASTTCRLPPALAPTAGDVRHGPEQHAAAPPTATYTDSKKPVYQALIASQVLAGQPPFRALSNAGAIVWLDPKQTRPPHRADSLNSIHRLIRAAGARRNERCPLSWDDGNDKASSPGFERTPDKCDRRVIRRRPPRGPMTRILCRGPGWSRRCRWPSGPAFTPCPSARQHRRPVRGERGGEDRMPDRGAGTGGCGLDR